MASTSIVPAAQTVLPDEIWEDIFLRFDAAADLARASAACYSFRHIVSARRFLRRFLSLHSPPVLGFISTHRRPQFVPVKPPHRSSPEASALEQAADFTFSFLPDPSAWRFRHARDGRVLLGQRISTNTQFEDFLVCDPLHRRYVKIPRIPNDLMASAPDNGIAHHVLPVLAPAGENDEEKSFRVICTVQLKHKVVGFVFSSCNQTWRVRAIVGAEEGRLGFLTIGDDTIDLYCKNWQSNGVGAQEWQHDRLIPLPKDTGISYTVWTIAGTVGHYLALLGSRQISHEL